MTKDIRLEIKIRNKDKTVKLHQVVDLDKIDWEDTMDCYKTWWRELMNSVSSSDKATLPIESIVTQPKDEN